jgi:dienelactone hydrolase
VIVLHGTGSSRLGVAAHARLLVRHGYGVLALDLAGHGASRGRSTSIPWRLDDDLDTAVDWLAARHDVHGGRIAAVGVSLGGEVALQFAARRPDLRATVAEGLMGSTGADAQSARQSLPRPTARSRRAAGPASRRGTSPTRRTRAHCAPTRGATSAG